LPDQTKHLLNKAPNPQGEGGELLRSEAVAVPQSEVPLCKLKSLVMDCDLMKINPRLAKK